MPRNLTRCSCVIAYLSDGVSAGAVSNLSGRRAVGSVSKDNFGGVDNGAVVVVGESTGHEGSRSSDG